MLDRAGWPETSPFAGGSAGQPLAALRDVPLLVVRAEWGMGKSFVFRQEHEELRSTDVSAGLLELGRCGASEPRAVAKLSEVFQPPATSVVWHVLLDGLDDGIEALSDLPELIVEQVQGLKEEARRLLRLRISCRTARWPARLETELRQLWPEEDQVKVVTLTPLSREDVSLAAHRMAAPDASGFPDLVERLGLVPLATHPMTLLQLLEGYREKRSLPATAQEAYQQACLRLCRELRRPKAVEQLRTQAAPEHLLAVAARVAAVLQFGPWSVVSDADVHNGSLADDAVALSRLGPGVEPGHLGHEVQCTLAELRQLTESSLLVPVGDYRWVFAHKSYQEFLAAEFLRVHRTDPAAQRGLLWIGDGPGRHVIAKHQEVAAWRSGSDPTVFADLLDDDPAVALLSRDLATRPEADRARAVEAVLRLLQRDDTAELDRAVLHRLNHPNLAGQLRPHLAKDEDNSWLVYWTANIARTCPRPELADDLLAVAENPAHDPEVRVAAVRGVTAPDKAGVERLQRLAEDESAEIVAAALQELRPDHLPLAEFLNLFREPEPTYVGTAWALRREIPDQLTPAEIGEATRWARGVLASGDQGSPSLAISVLARAITLTTASPEPNELKHLVADALLGAADENHLLFSDELRGPRDDLNHALSAQEDPRRQIVLRLLTHGSTEQSITLIAGLSMILPDDLLHWVENWQTLSTVDPRITGYLVRFPRPDDPAFRARCEAARTAHPTLRKATEFWDTPRKEPVWQRRDRERAKAERQRNTYCATDLHAALDAVLTADADRVRALWGGVIGQMVRATDGSAYQPTGLLLTLAAEAPSRPAPGTELGRKLEQAARHVLREAPVLNANDIGPHGVVALSQAPELTALALIDSLTGITSDTARRAGWAVALASTVSHRGDALQVQRRFLPQCSQHAAEALAPLLATVLDHTNEETARTIAVSFADPSYDDHARGVLRDWAGRPDRTPEQWQAILGVLALGGDDNALEAVTEELKTDPGALERNSPARHRWFLAVQILLQSDRLLEFWSDIHRRLRTPTIFASFIERIARIPMLTGGWPAPVGRLPEPDLADIYRMLIEHLGIEKAANPPLRSGFVTDHDRIGEMVRTLPHILAARATSEAALELRALAEQYPQIPQLRFQARNTARAAAARAAAPLTPEKLMPLVAQTHLRVVHDPRQLLDLVIEALQTMEGELQGYNGTAVNLWNRDKAAFDSETRCWPAWEEDLCDAVASFLRREIGGNRTVINREVGVRRTGLPGLRTDIHIDIPADASHQSLRLVIECKGCWNKELPTALEKQLTAYLTEPRTAGLLLVGYFDCTRWNHKKRGCPIHNHEIEQIRKDQLDAAARAQAQGSFTVSSYVLDCQLPGAESDWRKPSPPSS